MTAELIKTTEIEDGKGFIRMNTACPAGKLCVTLDSLGNSFFNCTTKNALNSRTLVYLGVIFWVTVFFSGTIETRSLEPQYDAW